MKSTLKRAGYKALHRQMNDVHLQFISKVAFFIITMFSFNLFFAGHYTPGGGFVGGLLMSSAVLLLLIAYDIKTLRKMLPIPLKFLISLGLLFALGVPLFLMIFGKPFFTHALTDIAVPILGDIHIHSAVFFDLGVFLVVFGVSILILVSVGEVKD